MESSGDGEPLPACKYGVKCYRTNPDHLAKFSHPPKTAVQSPEKRISAPVTSENASLVVVLLVGVPGSGKSRFCHSVIENAAQNWTRICQDIIANGKRGTKAQCIKEATNALNSSSSVFIDRTNLQKEQRLEFVQLAGKCNVEAHAVVLNLPVGICITRAMNRSSHEGGLQGKNVAAVIQRMAKDVELPTLEEGFSRITVCRNDSDVQNAISTYRQLSPSSKLEPGVFDANPNSTTKGSLEQFLKPNQSKESTKAAGSSASAGIQKYVKSNVGVERKPDNGGGSSSAETSEERWKTLAFPSISTADFRFDHQKAAQIIVETASEFFKREENAGLRLVMVDIQANSDMLSRVRKLAESAGLDPQRFLTVSGDITKLKSTGGPSCSVIANAANWRLKGGGGGVNLAIYKAAGPSFEEATKRCANTLDPGKVVAVPLPSDSPLRTKEGVSHVIHVLGPNMNPQRPNYVGDNYTEGSKLLREAYTNLFSTFGQLVNKSTSKGEGSASASKNTSSSNAPPRDAFAVLMKRKTGNDDVPANSLKRGREAEGQEATGTHTQEVNARKPMNWPAWAQALHDVAFHPEKHKNVVLEVTDTAVVLPDLYSKGKKHLLVVCRVNGLDSIADVRKEHLPVLQEMHAIGERWARKFIKEDPSLVFRLGYHSVPSMRQLHMHVISQDFDSPGLKNKKHWNSFTTAFFRDSKDVMNELETTGSLKQCSEEMEKSLIDSELRCHRCRCVQPNIPRLKSHLANCTKPFPFQDALITSSS